jgi:RP/EB family microtubule-associated protein
MSCRVYVCMCVCVCVCVSWFEMKLSNTNTTFQCQQEYQFVQNFKILQKVFNKENIPKHVEVERLVKGKYQDNLEMLQWMKHFFETRYSGDTSTYDAVTRRKAAIARFNGGRNKALRAKKPTEGKKASVSVAAASSDTKDSKENLAPSSSDPPAAKPSIKQSTSGRPVARAAPARVAKRPVANTRQAKSSGSSKDAAQNKELQGKVASLEEQLAQLRITVEGLEKERDFYYNKLREVEIMCSAEEENEEAPPSDKAFVKRVLDILYKEDEDFHQPEAEASEEANATPAEESAEPAEAAAAE